MNMTLGNYQVTATNMETGQQASFEIFAMDAGEALWKVEKHGIFAADEAVFIGDAEERQHAEFVSY